MFMIRKPFCRLMIFYIDMCMNMSEFIVCIHHACAMRINQNLHTKAIYSHLIFPMCYTNMYFMSVPMYFLTMKILDQHILLHMEPDTRMYIKMNMTFKLEMPVVNIPNLKAIEEIACSCAQIILFSTGEIITCQRQLNDVQHPPWQ